MESAVIETCVLDLILQQFNELTENPEIYVQQQLEKSEKFKVLTKYIYDATVSANFLTGVRAKSLAKLLYKGFDDEQIFQQIEIQNKSFLSNLKPEYFTQLLPLTKTKAFSDHGSSAEEEYAFDDDSDSSTEFVKTVENNPDSDFDSSAELVESVEKKRILGKKKPKSKVDDQFFKLSKLEEFLKIEDLKEGEEYVDASDDDNDINLFQDIPSDSLEEVEEFGDEEKVKKSTKDLMYEDFFDSPDSGDESIDREEVHMDNSGKDEKSDQYPENDISVDVKKNEEDEDHFEMDIDTQNSTDDKNNPKSTFELEQEKVRKMIAKCEKSMMEPLPWHLTGEVDASNRPIDSLIHLEADFDSNVKKDLIVDSTLTERTENIITMAVINNAFCDVERKVKPTNEIIAYKKELDQAKSKKSLAEVYEEDYLKKQSKQKEEEENPKHKEIKKLMESLEPELLALFSHIPKPAIPEIKIVSNLPAITVEEVAPTSVSDVTMLAPEEVKRRSGLVKGKSERTDTDRKRERRKKKVHQKLKEKKRKDKLELQKANPSSRSSKLEKLETLKKLKQHKNTKIATVDDGGKIKSSKDFFSRLQDTVESKAKTKNQVSFKKKK